MTEPEETIIGHTDAGEPIRYIPQRPQPLDDVNHPNHYGGKDNPYETIKIIEALNLGFHDGNALKYITRAGHKTGESRAKDLAKAAWYLNRLVTIETEREARNADA